MKVEQYEQAVSYMEKCLEYTPPVPEYAHRWVGLGEAYIATGNRLAAEQAFLTALSIRPDLESVEQRLSELDSGE